MVHSDKVQKLTLGISACLLGHKVRFNAGHKRHGFCADQLSEVVQWVAHCPEVAIGLPTPRPAIRQVHRGDVIAVEWSKVKDGETSPDFAPLLVQDAQSFSRKHGQLDGFVTMHDSPSCGSRNVKIYRANGHQAGRAGVGKFAASLMALNPLLPVEDAGRLNDPVIAENFLVRVEVYHAWQQFLNRHPTPTLGQLIHFYSPYKYLLMAHSQLAYKQVGRLLADASSITVEAAARQFIGILMQGLSVLASRKSHANVLMHLLGYFKRDLSGADKREILTQITQYRAGTVPLITPLVLLKHHLKKSHNVYLLQQKYWQPHAESLGLRSAI